MKKENLNIKGKAYYQNLKTRYLNAAKEAAGDRILKEYNLQFAEHYSRLISEKFPPQQNVSPMPQDNTSSENIIENKAKCTNRKVARKPQAKIKESETVS